MNDKNIIEILKKNSVQITFSEGRAIVIWDNNFNDIASAILKLKEKEIVLAKGDVQVERGKYADGKNDKWVIELANLIGKNKICLYNVDVDKNLLSKKQVEQLEGKKVTIKAVIEK